MIIKIETKQNLNPTGEKGTIDPKIMLHLSEIFCNFELMQKRKKFRRVNSYKDYFNDFFNKQPIKVKTKIIWTLELLEEVEMIPETYLKHITNTDGLYEIRVKFSSNIYRIFCFFDGGKLIIIINGFVKKSQKTPKNQINKALTIKKEYENEK